MHLILSKACSNGAAAITLYVEKYPQCRLLNASTFHQADWYCSPFYSRPWKEKRTLYIVLFIITVTFPHPDCIWIYGNKDDDDDDDDKVDVE
jgi:hypothetical protein